MKKKVLYSDIKETIDNSSAKMVAIIMGILVVIAMVVIAVFGG